MTTAIAYVHAGDTRQSFTFSLARLMVYEMAQRRPPPLLISQRAGSGQLVAARNGTVKFFLDNTEAEWCMFVDTDMGFAGDTLDALIGSADPVERPVVGALCFGLRRNGDEDWELQATAYRQFPTVYMWAENEREVGFSHIPNYPVDSLVQVAATGAACFVAHRSVLEKIRETSGDHWFDQILHPRPEPEGTLFSEDLSFFVRVGALDIPVFVDTGVKTSHDKGALFLTEETWQAQRTLEEIATACHA